MIYPDYKLHSWGAERCGIVPYTHEHVNPASVDLCVDSQWIDVTTGENHITQEITIYPPNNLRELWYNVLKFLRLNPEHKPTVILATTVEYITMCDEYEGHTQDMAIAGDVKLKSSMARSGLDHSLAGWIDPGFRGQITLELHAHRKVTLQAGQRICQLIVHGMYKPHRLYNGRYQDQFGPQGARDTT